MSFKKKPAKISFSSMFFGITEFFIFGILKDFCVQHSVQNFNKGHRMK